MLFNVRSMVGIKIMLNLYGYVGAAAQHQEVLELFNRINEMIHHND